MSLFALRFSGKYFLMIVICPTIYGPRMELCDGYRIDDDVNLDDNKNNVTDQAVRLEEGGGGERGRWGGHPAHLLHRKASNSF